LVPKFIVEASPNELKGAFGAISQFMVTIGILLVALLGLNIPYFTFQSDNYCNVLWVSTISETYKGYTA
jgi:hypothetical protein